MNKRSSHLISASLCLVLLLQASCATSGSQSPSVVSFADTCSEETDESHLRNAAWLLGTGLALVGTHYATKSAFKKPENQAYHLYLTFIPGVALSQLGAYSLFVPSTEEVEAEKCRKIRELMRRDLEAMQQEKSSQP